MGMMLRPAVRTAGPWYELPGPITGCRIQESWDAERFKVPLRAGDQVAGLSRNGIDVTLRGAVGKRGEAAAFTEQAMWDTLLELREKLDVAGETKFELRLLADGDRADLLTGCTTTRFEYDLSNPSLFSYSVQIHATSAEVVTRVS